MKSVAFALLLAFLLPAAQRPKEEWQRVYSSQDSLIDLDVSKVTFVQQGTKVTFAGAQIGRVVFRTVLSKPEELNDQPALKYKTRIENIEFKCAEKQYRVHDARLLDDKGRLVKSLDWDATAEWKEVRFGSMMAKLALPACKLIEEKREHP